MTISLVRTLFAAALLSCCLGAALTPQRCAASERTAARHVRAGLEAYREGDYQRATSEFSSAEAALPENPRIAYDLACARAAAGKLEEAIDYFQRAASAADPSVLASSRYNLGCVLAQKAKQRLGQAPEAADPTSRQEALEQLAQAVASYRDCLRVDPQHQRARRNLELLRLWIKHMQDVWAQRDREKRRDEMNLLQFLEMIQSTQQTLRETVAELAAAPATPRQRQALTLVKNRQQELAEEIKPLQDKIQEAFAASRAALPNVTPQTNPMEGKAQQLASQARRAMLQAVASLQAFETTAAATAQLEASDHLNTLYMALAPFEHLLQKAIATQQSLVDQAELKSKDPQRYYDFSAQAGRQTRVHQWSNVLPLKAQQQLDQLHAQDQAAAASARPQDPPAQDPPEQGPADQAAPPAPSAVISSAQGPPGSDNQAKMAPLKKAIELAPRIQQLTMQAADDLSQEDVSAALPKQQEALEMLKEIARSMPPPDPKQQQQEQQEKQQEQKDQQESKQEPPDSQKDKQQQQDQNPEQDQDSQDGQDRQQQKAEDEPSSPRDRSDNRRQPPSSLSPQQAQAIMQKVIERERKHREAKKELQGILRGRIQVDKDW